MLTHRSTHATVTLCNEATPHVAARTRIADVVVAPPVGGVGPMTRAMLLTNVVKSAERELDAAQSA